MPKQEVREWTVNSKMTDRNAAKIELSKGDGASPACRFNSEGVKYDIVSVNHPHAMKLVSGSCRSETYGSGESRSEVTHVHTSNTGYIYFVRIPLLTNMSLM